MSSQQRIELGPESLLEETPVGITVNNTRYILNTRTDGSHVVYTAVCPHQNGRVMVKNESVLFCPNHQWEFDSETGECLTVSGECLPASPITVDNGIVYLSESDR